MRTLFGLCLVGFFAACAVPQAEEPASLPAVQILPAGEDFPVAPPERFSPLTGYLAVPENHDDLDSRRIELPFIVLKATEPKRDLAPVLLILGGPGTGALNAAAYPGAYPWTADRDFIIFGQRGTEYAKPSLMCRGFGEAYRGSDISASIEQAKACKTASEADGADLANYHSAATAADIDALRDVLGYDQLALFGLSYGTRVALTYARDFPDRVQSMVLDGPLPHDASFDDESPLNVRYVIDEMLADCAGQAACGEAFPDLAPRFFEAIEEIEETGLFIAGEDRTAADIINALPIGGASEAVFAPIVFDAVARRDVDVLAELFKDGGSATNFAWGMRLAVWCSEDAPFAKGDAEGFAGLGGRVFDPAVCDAFGVPRRPVSEKRVTTGDIPTLIIASTYDTATPPPWAYRVEKTLSTSFALIMRQGFHVESVNWDGDGCAKEHAATFFADPGAYFSATQPTCHEGRMPITFKTELP